MNVVVLIDGREAIPVRAIPFVTGWSVSPDVVAQSLANPTKEQGVCLDWLTAYQYHADGIYTPILPKEWDGIEDRLRGLSASSKAKSNNNDIARTQWLDESIPLIPAGVFVWRDEFEKSWRRYSWQMSGGKGERPGDWMLNFSPMIPDDELLCEQVCKGFTFQRAVTDTPPQAPDEARGQAASSGATEKDAPEVTPDDWMAEARAIAESNIPRDDTLVLRLAKWFDKSIDDLPPKPREIAEAYIPGWSELSGAKRRERADEVDRQRQDALAAKFEKFRRDVEQANAAMPDRFKEREFQDGFNKVEREKNGERDFEAKRGAVNLSDARCIELARKAELEIAEWIELTGVGIGECHCLFLVATDGVSFIKHEQDFIQSMLPEQQIGCLRDNQHEPLEFPCTPAKMMDFIDSDVCSIRGCFSVPDAFRQAVTESAQASDTATHVPAESQGPPAFSGATEKDAPEVTPDDDGQSEAATPVAPEKAEAPAERRAKHDMTTERGCRRRILEHWDTIEKLHGPMPDCPQIWRIVVRNLQDGEKKPVLKTVRNVRDILRKEGLIP